MSNTILTGEVAADILAAMQKAGLNGWEMFVPEGVLPRWLENGQ